MDKTDDDENTNPLASLRSMMESAANSGGNIVEAIMGFLKFLFDSFLPSKDAPDEDVGDDRSPGTSIKEAGRIGRLIIDKNAIPKWQAFQKEHQDEHVDFINPVKSNAFVDSNFGMRMHPIQHKMKMHTGVDIDPVGSANPDIAASASGIVLYAGWKQGYGNTVIIGHSDGSYTLYGHMRGEKMPDIGDQVEQGQTIGVMGKTGGATGVHLHYEQRKGSEPIQPVIAGVSLQKGVQLAENTSPAFAHLTDPSKHPKLSVSSGTPAAVVFNGHPLKTAHARG